MSPAAVTAGRDNGVFPEKCPFCSELGTHEHIFWECSKRLMKHKPADAIQKRLLWPTGKANRRTKDEEILGAAEATVRRV